MPRIPLGAAIELTYPLRDTSCPFGCGDTLVYTTNGVQCSTEACASRGGPISRIPAQSPYQHGARVQMHGYAGNPEGHRRTGFRGVVTGSLGSTILRGATDEGEEWGEYWGALVPDGTRESSWMRCTCCPGPEVQLALFEVAR